MSQRLAKAIHTELANAPASVVHKPICRTFAEVDAFNAWLKSKNAHFV